MQAARDKPAPVTETVMKRIYQYSGLTKEDRRDKRVTAVMDLLGSRFAERLGLSHKDIMKSHEAIE
jgi:hypothetical protein